MSTNFNPRNVKVMNTAKGKIYTGTLDSGRSINVRSFSSEGNSTIEIIENQSNARIKFRFEE